jgi:(2R)-3-sulfolactate dehydrogenase (NADP+)
MSAVVMSLDEARRLCERAALASGASAETASSLAASVVAAEAEGQPNRRARPFPRLSRRAGGRADRRPGRAAGHAAAAGDLPFRRRRRRRAYRLRPGIRRSRRGGPEQLGVALSSPAQRLYLRRARLLRRAARGAAAWSLAATNGPALIAPAGGRSRSTAPIRSPFAAPTASGPPLLIDQSSSATAFVNVRLAAKEGRPIPEGWAIDADGRPTTDPAAA